MSETNDRKVAQAPSPKARRVFLVAFPTPAILPVENGVIGRETLETAKVFDKTVSQKHLHVVLGNSHPQVVSLGRNGVSVEGFALDKDEKVSLHDGAVIRMSETILVYREAYAGPEKPAGTIGTLHAPFTLHSTREALAALSLHVGDATPHVLIEGETGTGKEGLALAVRDALRPNGPFEAFNAAAVPKELCDSILFGAEKGAFTGAHRREEGLFRRNDRGAVFIDEVGELPLGIQSKLLRVLQEGEVQRVGGAPVRVNVLVISATNVGLKARVNEGLFRRDLFERLGKRLQTPPLAARIEDLPSILLAMSKRKGPSYELRVEPSAGALGGEGGTPTMPDSHARVEAEAMEKLMLRVFKGNIRTAWRVVEAAIDRALIHAVKERPDGSMPRPTPVLHAWALAPEIELDGVEILRRVPCALPRKLLLEAMSAVGKPDKVASPYSVAAHLRIGERWCETAMKAAGLLR